VTVTFRDLWLRRQRVSRATRFQLAHNLNRAMWADDKIEWHQIDTGGLSARQRADMVLDTFRLQLAERNRFPWRRF